MILYWIPHTILCSRSVIQPQFCIFLLFPPVCLPVCLAPIYLSIYLSIPSIYLAAYFSIHLSIHLSTYLFVGRSICPPIHSFIHSVWSPRTSQLLARRRCLAEFRHGFPAQEAAQVEAGPLRLSSIIWVVIKELELSYQNSETPLFAIKPCYGNLD